MKRVFFMVAIISFMAVSCNKNDSESDLIPVTQADYMQLKIGNYWVYEWYRTDSTGQEIPTNQTSDSSIIIGDTNIQDILYYKLLSMKYSHITYIRDSSGYLINLEGEILFSDHDLINIIRIDTIGPGIAYVEYTMHINDSIIETPIGVQPTLELRGKVIPVDPQYPHGINYTHYYYADGYGMVKSSSYYFSSPHIRIGQRLISFGNILE